MNRYLMFRTTGKDGTVETTLVPEDHPHLPRLQKREVHKATVLTLDWNHAVDFYNEAIDNGWLDEE